MIISPVNIAGIIGIPCKNCNQRQISYFRIFRVSVRPFKKFRACIPVEDDFFRTSMGPHYDVIAMPHEQPEKKDFHRGKRSKLF